MKKRTFIKLSTALVGGSVFSPLATWPQETRLKNWAGNYEYSTNRIENAGSVEQVRDAVKKIDKLKVLGTRHCFNSIADSTHQFISLKDMDQVVSIDPKALTVTVEAGVNYGKLSQYLFKNGFALHNLASLPHISVAGACSTATHGSGVTNGNLSTAVSALEIVTAAGEVLVLSREHDGEKFQAAVVGLGGLGVITKVTLKIQPTFMMRQFVYEGLPYRQLEAHFDQILSSGYSVSLFTDWQRQSFNQIWIKSRVGDESNFEAKPVFFEAKAATRNLHPISTLSAENCTEQMGVPGPWHERLPHFRMGFTPSSGVELQSEYFVPYHDGFKAILAVDKLREQVAPYLLISEIRTIKADDFWMSPCYKQSCMTIHFTWKQDWPSVRKLLPLIEEQLAPFNARPHWGKLFTISPARLKSLYEKLPEFQKMLKSYDPQGKFRNNFLDTNIYGV